jgi:serine/threonine protein kinase
VRGSEEWARFLFLQFIAGLKKIHAKNIAHLNINKDIVLVDIDDNWQPCIKISGFELSQRNHLEVRTPYGEKVRAPELRGDDYCPYDGEKADVFASALILLAIYASDNFKTRGLNDKRFIPYDYFIKNRHLDDYWETLGLRPT